MTVSSFDVVFYTLAFLVPGFICDSVLSVFVRRRTVAHETSLLRFLTLSAVNYGLWSWLIYLMAKSNFFIQSPVHGASAWVLIVFISPVGLGAVLGLLSQRNAFRGLLERYGVYTVHPIPTAWDYFFSNRTPVWVLVTTTDNDRVAGRFGAASFASSDRFERDLYIETVYRVEEEGPWTEVPMNRGIWIPGKQIKHIEFWTFW
jgi:hypothetical protein